MTVYGDGSQSRCFLHVHDAVGAILALSAHDGAIGRAFNIGNPTPITILALAERIIERIGSSSKIRLVPYEEAYDDGFEELGRRRPDTTALQELTGWRPHRTLDEALDDVIAYQRAELTSRAPIARRTATVPQATAPARTRDPADEHDAGLVTGGGGFIGSHLAAHLLEQGHRVRVLDNFATGRRSNVVSLGGEVELIEGDIQSYERVEQGGGRLRGRPPSGRAAVGPALGPGSADQQRDQRDRHAQRAARRARPRRPPRRVRVLVVGVRRQPPGAAAKREDRPALPISPYATAKLAGEGYARSFHGVYGLETVALRYFNVFGPRQDPTSQYAAVIPNFITALLAGEPPVIFGDGEQSRDFTYVANVVQANVLAIDAPGRRRARSTTSPAASG